MISFTQRPDGPLFHYTTQAGLLGIIESREIWATDIRYLNDASELGYGLDLARDLMRDAHKEGELTKRAYDVADALSRSLAHPHIFVASFSERGDLLSQWRGYSERGDGFSLGFDMSTLAEAQTRFGRVHFSLERCVYDHRQQKGLLREALSKWFAGGRDSDGEQPKNSLGIGVDLVRLSARLKHPSFCEESEWRLVSTLVPRSHPCVAFREGRAVLTPYFRLGLASPDGCIPLSKVIVGPTPHMELALQSTRDFLASKGVTIAPDRVVPSEIPYRSW